MAFISIRKEGEHSPYGMSFCIDDKRSHLNVIIKIKTPFKKNAKTWYDFDKLEQYYNVVLSVIFLGRVRIRKWSFVGWDDSISLFKRILSIFIIEFKKGYSIFSFNSKEEY